MPMVVRLFYSMMEYTSSCMQKIVYYHIKRNHCAYLSHRKKKLSCSLQYQRRYTIQVFMILSSLATDVISYGACCLLFQIMSSHFMFYVMQMTHYHGEMKNKAVHCIGMHLAFINNSTTPRLTNRKIRSCKGEIAWAEKK